MQIEFEQCKRCGRKLKTVKSMADGFGPVCKKKFEAGKASKQLTLEEEIERTKLPFDDTEDVTDAYD